MVKFDVKALAAAAAVLGAGWVLLTGAANIIQPAYAGDFLRLMSSIYPGYHASGTVGDLMVGTLYALADGALCGAVFGWLYNLFAGRSQKRAAGRKSEKQSPAAP
jgi:hypothetical protein